MKQVFDGQAADGTSSRVRWTGGKGTYIASGTFGGGTLSLVMGPEGGTLVDAGSDGHLTANGAMNFEINADTMTGADKNVIDVALKLTGSAGPSLDAWIGEQRH